MLSYISLDLETSGFSPTQNEILEIGAVKVVDGVTVGKFSQIIKPLGYVSRGVLDVTGLTREQLNNGENLETTLQEFYDFCEDFPILGHNIGFDYRFLVEKCKHIGLDFSLNKRRLGVNTLEIARKYLSLPSNKLLDVARYLGVPFDESKLHRAEYDAIITKMVYERMQANWGDLTDVKNPKLLDKDANNYGRVVNNDALDFE